MQTNMHTLEQMTFGGQEVECRLICSKTAKRIRVRIKPESIEVVVPICRDLAEGRAFVRANEDWVCRELERARGLRALRRSTHTSRGHLLLRGAPTQVFIKQEPTRKAPNQITYEEGTITITCGPSRIANASKSLENWLRKLARQRIGEHVETLSSSIKRRPNNLYIMGQRTKWGNCSKLGNLSFNWRLILAPDYVLRYLVTHEMVHLAIPDHSHKFWLTVQSLCRDTEKARQWLVANEHHLRANLEHLLASKL